MDNNKYKSYFEDQGPLWMKCEIPILGQEQKFKSWSEQSQRYKSCVLKLEDHYIYRQQPNPECLDLRNARLEFINLNETGRGVRISKNGDNLDLYGPFEDWLPTLKKYCIQTQFTTSFLVQKQIGKGNFGKVYKAIRKSDNSEVAVKVFEKKLLVNAQDRPALLKELDILRRLNHRGVLGLYETFESEQFIFVVQELLKGGELYDNLKKIPPLSEEKAAKIIDKLLESLEYINSLGILHRDLKPENIILRKKGELEDLVIADFGLADYYKKDGNYLFTRCGTPGYVAPEVLQDKLYDYKVDVYSIGVLLYVFLAGKSPFKGKDYEEVVYLNYKGDIDYNCLTVSQECLNLIQRMLDPNPIKRWTAEQVRKHPWFRKWIRKSQVILVKRMVKLDRTSEQSTPTTSTPKTSNSLNNFIDNSPRVGGGEHYNKHSVGPKFFATKEKISFKSLSRAKLQSQLSPL